MLLVVTKHSEKSLCWRSSHYNTISSLHCFSPSNGTFGSQYLYHKSNALAVFTGYFLNFGNGDEKTFNA